MTPNPSPEQRIVGCSLSNYLADRRQRIVSEWMASVRSDPAVPAADELTVTQLKDHIPQILDDLSRTLEDALNQEVKERARWRAATHGHIRWEERYEISQLILEISDLRTVLIHHLAEFQDTRIPNFNGELGQFAMVVLHSFCDRLIQISVEQFIAASKRTRQAT
jgi:hypothetical protein